MLLRRQEVRKNEPIAMDDFADQDRNRGLEHRAIIHKRMEFSVFAARINGGGEVLQEARIEVPPGEAWYQGLRVDASDLCTQAGINHGPGEFIGGNLPDRKKGLQACPG